MARLALFKRLCATLASATLLVLARPACAKPVEVTRFSTPQTLAQLGWQQAGRAVAVVPAPDSGIDPQSLVDQPWLDAVAREVAALGFGAATPGAADILAEVDVVHDRLAQGGGRGPVSVGLGGATGGRHSSLGLGLGFNFGGGVRHLDGTRLRVILRDRASGQALWEGRADNTEKSGSREASADLLAPRMAHALFTGFPGPSGQTTSVK